VCSDEEGDDDPDDDNMGVRVKRGAAGILEITIGGFRLTALNSLRQKCLKLDAATHKFIEGYFPEAVLAFCKAKSNDRQTPSALSQQSTTPVFSFTTVETPPIRDKVVWLPQTHTWKLILKRAPPGTDSLRDETGKALNVNPHLQLAEYRAAKKEAYERAKQAWNKLDGSTRYRISGATRNQEEEEAAHSQQAQTTADAIPDGVGSMHSRWNEDNCM